MFNIYHLGLAVLLYLLIFNKSKISSLEKIIKSLKGSNKKNNHTKEIIVFLDLPLKKEYYDPDEEKLSYNEKYSSAIKNSVTAENLNNK